MLSEPVRQRWQRRDRRPSIRLSAVATDYALCRRGLSEQWGSRLVHDFRSRQRRADTGRGRQRHVGGGGDEAHVLIVCRGGGCDNAASLATLSFDHPPGMPSPSENRTQRVAVIGGGPAGLMAAEALAAAGVEVDLYDTMPSVGRKFLMAGKGGMNLTHSEPADIIPLALCRAPAQIEPLLRRFDASALRAWVHGLGVKPSSAARAACFPPT